MPSDSAGEDEPIKTVMVMPWRLSVRVYGDGRGRLWAHLDDLIRVLGETCAVWAEEGDAIEEVEGIPIREDEFAIRIAALLPWLESRRERGDLRSHDKLAIDGTIAALRPVRERS